MAEGRSAAALLVALTLACGPTAGRGDSSATQSGPDPTPTITEAACEGEGCQAEFAAVACRNVVLAASPTNGAGALMLQPGDTVNVRSDLHLKQPGVVILKRDHTQPDEWNSGSVTGGEPPPLRFAAGDTLLLLNYIGEGFWKASYQGGPMEVLEFWGGPGQAERSASDSAQAEIASGTAPLIDTWWAVLRGDRVVGWWRRDTTHAVIPIGEYGEMLGFRCRGG